MWDLGTWKNIGTGCLFVLIFTWPLIIILVHGTVTGEPFCACACHDPEPPRYKKACSCGDRW